MPHTQWGVIVVFTFLSRAGMCVPVSNWQDDNRVWLGAAPARYW